MFHPKTKFTTALCQNEAQSIDNHHTVPRTENTISNAFSATKCMTSLSALLLVDRGELYLDETVVKYWPDFTTNGNAEIKVRQLLSVRCQNEDSVTWHVAKCHLALCGWLFLLVSVNSVAVRDGNCSSSIRSRYSRTRNRECLVASAMSSGDIPLSWHSWMRRKHWT